MNWPTLMTVFTGFENGIKNNMFWITRRLNGFLRKSISKCSVQSKPLLNLISIAIKSINAVFKFCPFVFRQFVTCSHQGAVRYVF